MSFGPAEFGCQEGLDEVPSHSRPNGPATHAEDVHVIILDSLPGREMIVDQRSADAGILLAQTEYFTRCRKLPRHIDLPRRHSLTEGTQSPGSRRQGSGLRAERMTDHGPPRGVE
jgi:hypothetical protein